MTWERFGYICRKACVDNNDNDNDNELIATLLSRIRNEESCKLYGEELRTHSLPSKILQQIATTNNKRAALAALCIYKDLNLSGKFEEPMRFKRVVAYLSYVTLIFYLVVGIYQLKVAPTFSRAFEDFNLSTPQHLDWYYDYWGYFVLAVSLLLATSLVIGHHLRKIFKFEPDLENSLVLKYLVFRNIRESYIQVNEILQFPILKSTEQHSDAKSEIIEHLIQIESSNMDVAVEMNELLRIRMRTLLESCERQMKYISILVALVVVTAIFFFLASAYSPIFVLGETI